MTATVLSNAALEKRKKKSDGIRSRATWQPTKRFSLPSALMLNLPWRVKQALREAKTRHARRWQTKEGTYRLKGQPLPDVRDMDTVMADSSAGHS